MVQLGLAPDLASHRMSERRRHWDVGTSQAIALSIASWPLRRQFPEITKSSALTSMDTSGRKARVVHPFGNVEFYRRLNDYIHSNMWHLDKRQNAARLLFDLRQAKRWKFYHLF